MFTQKQEKPNNFLYLSEKKKKSYTFKLKPFILDVFRIRLYYILAKLLFKNKLIRVLICARSFIKSFINLLLVLDKL